MNLDEQYRFGWLKGFAEALAERIGKLEQEMRFVRKGMDDLMAEKAAFEDRVSELEARIPEPEIRTRPAKADTHDGRCVVPEARILRWEKIERAGSAFLDAVMTEPIIEWAGTKGEALREALKNG